MEEQAPRAPRLYASGVSSRVAAAACLGIAIGLVAAACDSFGEATDGNGPPPESDAGGDADSAMPSDDARSPNDAASGDLRRCTGTTLLDDAFDRKIAQGPGWSGMEGAPLLSVTEGRPAPALLAALPPHATSGDTSAARLVRDFANAPARLCIELDLRVGADASAYAPDGFTEIIQLFAAGAPTMFLQLESDGMNLVAGSATRVLAGFPLDTWRHVVVRLNFGASPPTLAVDAEGLKDQIAIVPAPSAPPTAVELSLGALTRGPAAAASVLADNVHVTAE